MLATLSRRTCRHITQDWTTLLTSTTSSSTTMTLKNTTTTTIARFIAAGSSQGASTTTATTGIAPEVIAKARKMSPPLGLAAGLFGSLVGVGGGIVIVPAIVSACKTIPQRLVSGTSLAAVLSTAVVSAATYAQAGCVDIAAAAVISPFAMMTAPLGARLTSKLDCTALRRILGYFLLCVAPLIPLKAYLLHMKENTTTTSSSSGTAGGSGKTASGDSSSTTIIGTAAVDASSTSSSSINIIQTVSATTKRAAMPTAAAALLPNSPPLKPTLESLTEFFNHQSDAIKAMGLPTVLFLAATGSVAGIASGLLGIGGGTIVTPLLALSLPYGQATVLGTSLLSMVPPSVAALAQHAKLGNVDWKMAAGLAMGTAVGGGLGSGVAVQAPPGVLEGCFAVGMLVLGRKTLQTVAK